MELKLSLCHRLYRGRMRITAAEDFAQWAMLSETLIPSSLPPTTLDAASKLLSTMRPTVAASSDLHDRSSQCGREPRASDDYGPATVQTPGAANDLVCLFVVVHEPLPPIFCPHE
ncbi:hypothetical protein TanjilG_12855 [Lupinus angustifolius]|uniref:Uncharacterized protein n=1 Tax=Lupinus angustifolius TaxID=3871 RepID=A0A1J7HLE4_LUPAN|nr:hypothetical protein TanjilG_12855 [Lupinus angustifolius]